MNNGTAPARHLDDGELVRYIDAEGEPVDRHRWEVHLRGCRPCREEADALSAHGRAFSRWLRAADFEGRDAETASVRALAGTQAPTVPRARRPWVAASPWLKAAAVILLVAAPLAAIPPVRDWVADRVAGLVASQAPAPAVTHSPAESATPALIRFATVPGTFTLVLDATQAVGAIRLGRTTGPEAVLEITGSGATPEPVVSARHLRITNDPGTTASYTLLLPGHIDAVELDVAGRRTRVDGAALDARITLPLAIP